MDKEIKPRYPLLKKYGLPVGMAVLLAVVAIWAIAKGGTSSYKADTSAIIIDDVTFGAFNDYVRINGRVETGVVVQVSALETGLVERKWAEEGAMVKAGDIILTLRNPNLQQQILDSESQLAEKQNMLRDTEIAMEKERLQVKQNLLSTRTDLTRKRRLMQQQQTLYAENLTPREEYLKAEEDYKLALESLNLLEERLRQDSLYRCVQVGMMRESLRNMQENFTLVRQRADNLNIRASHSGQLGSLTAELGQSIAAGQQVGQINILDNYKIAVTIDEHYLDRVSSGLKGRFERQGATYGVAVSKVYPEVAQGAFKADLVIIGAIPDNIRVGQTCAIELQLGEPSQCVMVPRGSFFQTSGGHWVYVVDPDGKSATKRPIKIGRQNPRYYEVIEGLSRGEKIITSSYANFGEADRIILD